MKELGLTAPSFCYDSVSDGLALYLIGRFVSDGFFSMATSR